MAHELGHLVLHSSEMVVDPEDQADAFAAEFLMPIEVIRPRLRTLRIETLLALKREWGVSMAALIERAYGAGLMKSTQRQTLYKQFASRGWRVREPGSDELLPETPTLQEQVAAALRDGGFGDDEIAHLAGYATSAHNELVPSRSPRRTLRAI